MRVVRAEVAVECDDSVTDKMIIEFLRLHMAVCFNETRDGNINWRGMRVRVIRSDVDTSTWDWESPNSRNGN